MQKDLISKEVALEEVKNFILKIDESEISEDEIEESYPDVLKAVQSGNLVFDDNYKPTLTLKNPIKNDKGEDSVSVINFKTRIKPSEMKTVMAGVDMRKDKGEFILKATSFLTMQHKVMLDKFSKSDYRVIEQLCAVFM